MTPHRPPWLAPWLSDNAIRPSLSGDLSAAIIVTLMLIPQSLAYAILAGMPPHIGLYASVLPLIAYALFGRSPALAVGPVAIAAVMTFDALNGFAVPGSPEWVVGGMFLAASSGLMLLLMGVLRLGFLSELLSHPVMSGFVTGAAIIIMLGQLKALTGIPLQGETALGLLNSLGHRLLDFNPVTLGVGMASLVGLLLAKRWAKAVALALGARGLLLELLTKASPLLILAVVTVALVLLGFESQTRTIGVIPMGLPTPALPMVAPSQAVGLLISALLIGLVGYIESVSMARTIGRRRQVPVDPNAELRGLGAANIASGLTGAFPVTGGLSRSVVNLEAGAQTPMAGAYSAVLMVLVLLGAGSLLRDLPLAGLAALILVAVSSLIDVETPRRAWQYDRADGLSWFITFIGVLTLGVETGILLGISLSVGSILWRQSRPHIATLGRVPGTEHFRNVQRHAVETLPNVLFVRVDANLFFGNWTKVREYIDRQASELNAGGWVVLNLASVSDIDHTALEGLSSLSTDLSNQGISLRICEVKGPVSDKLRHHLPEGIPEDRSCFDAYQALSQ